MGVIKIGKASFEWGKDSGVHGKSETYLDGQVVYFDATGKKINSLAGLSDGDYITPNYLELEQKAFGLSPWVYIIIDRIAEASANIPIGLKDLEGNPISPRMMQSPKVRELVKLFKSPQLVYDNFSFKDLIYMLVAEYCLTGNAYMMGNPPGQMGLRYNNLIVPRVSNVSSNSTNGNIVENYTINYNNMTFTPSKDDVMHIYRPNLLEDLEEGHAPMQSLADIWRANNAINKNEYHTHKRRGANGLLYNEDGRVQSPKDRDKNQEKLDQVVSSQDRTGRYAYLGNKMGFINLSTSFKDLQNDKSKLSQMRTIAAAYRYPSELLNDPENKTYSNQNTAEKGAFDKAILPKLDLVLEHVNKWLIQGNYGLETVKLGYDRKEIPELNLVEADKTANDKLKSDVVTVVQRDIISGAVTYEQGFNNLVVNMRYTEEEALQLLGTPQKTPPTNNNQNEL